MGEVVSFHNFTLPEDICVRFLVMNLGRGMPESVVREELEALDIHVLGVMQLRFGRRDRQPTKDLPLTLSTSLYQWLEVLGCQRCDLSPNSEVCKCRCSRTWLQKADEM
jgi:hypothetical protein